MISKKLLNKEIKKPRLKFNLGLALIGPRTTIEFFHEKKTQDCNTQNFSDFKVEKPRITASFTGHLVHKN